MAIYVLVHGAWHGAWCFEKLVPLLQKKGHQIYAPDLPAHGTDNTPLKEVTLITYVDCLVKIIKGLNESVILVGHSMAGIVISQVAEVIPEKIKMLVYIAAFLPRNGDSLFSLAELQPPTRSSRLIKVSPQENAYYFPSHVVKDFLCHLCDDETIQKVESRIGIEPLLPSITPVNLTDHAFGKVPKVYIECTLDRAILIETQRKMHAWVPCQIITMACDHSPFYSYPQELAKVLLMLYLN